MRPIPQILATVLCSLAFSAFAAPLDNPTVKWRFQTDGSFRSAPALSDSYLYIGSSTGTLFAIERDTGALAWKNETNASIVASPALSDKRVFVANRNNTLLAIDRDTGKTRWTFQMGDTLPSFWAGWDYFTPSPTLSLDTCYIGGGDGVIYALNRSSGKLLWKFKTEGRIRSTALLHEGTLYQPSNDGYIYALNAKTGALEWKFETDGAHLDSSQFGFDRKSIFDKPNISGTQLICGSRDGHVYAIDLNTHEELWRFTYGPTWAMTSTISQDAALIGWSTNNLICSIDLESGKENWKFETGGHNYTDIVVTDDFAFLASSDGNLYRLDRYTGEKQWTYPIGCALNASPILDNDVLYLPTDDGSLLAIDNRPKSAFAVYHPNPLPEKLAFNLVDASIAPYLVERGFDLIASENELEEFVKSQTHSPNQAVVVMAFDSIPSSLLGADPSNGPLRKYLEAGNKILSFGTIPNLHSFDADGNYRRDWHAAEHLLEVSYPNHTESGTYPTQATQSGRNWGLPANLLTMNATVAPSGVTPLAIDEQGRVSAWIKTFSKKPGSGFVSCRSWSFGEQPSPSNLALIFQLATHELR